MSHGFQSLVRQNCPNMYLGARQVDFQRNKLSQECRRQGLRKQLLTTSQSLHRICKDGLVTTVSGKMLSDYTGRHEALQSLQNERTNITSFALATCGEASEHALLAQRSTHFHSRNTKFAQGGRSQTIAVAKRGLGGRMTNAACLK